MFSVRIFIFKKIANSHFPLNKINFYDIIYWFYFLAKGGAR